MFSMRPHSSHPWNLPQYTKHVQRIATYVTCYNMADTDNISKRRNIQAIANARQCVPYFSFPMLKYGKRLRRVGEPAGFSICCHSNRSNLFCRYYGNHLESVINLSPIFWYPQFWLITHMICIGCAPPVACEVEVLFQNNQRDARNASLLLSFVCYLSQIVGKSIFESSPSQCAMLGDASRRTALA